MYLADLSRGRPQCRYLFPEIGAWEGRRACVRVAGHRGQHLDYVAAASVGQETEPGAGEAAGEAAGAAAAKEAQNAEWPPTKGNAEAVGAAAGTAAGAAACAAVGAAAASPLCAYVGGKVGEFVGGAFYDLAVSWFGTSDATQRHLDALHRKETFDAAVFEAGTRLAVLAKSVGVYPKASIAYLAGFERTLMKKWGLRVDRGFGWDLQTDEQLSASLRLVFVAESARAAEIIAANPKPSSSTGTVVKVVAAASLLFVVAKFAARRFG